VTLILLVPPGKDILKGGSWRDAFTEDNENNANKNLFAAAEDERNQKDGKIREQEKLIDEIRRRKEAMKGEVKGVPGGSL